jgi:hypothetical protein
MPTQNPWPTAVLEIRPKEPPSATGFDDPKVARQVVAPECHQRMADQQDFEIKLVTETFILHPL